MRKLDQVVTFLLLAVILVGTLGVAPASQIRSAPAPSHANGTISYTFPPNDVVYPEGIAYHAGTGDFFVGSTAGGAVYRGSARRGSRTLSVFLTAGSDGRTDVRGMKVDPRGILYIAGGTTGRLWMYDAVTGRLLGNFFTGVDGAFINDVAIGPDGAAYFTDSRVPHLYRIKADEQGIFQYELWRDLRDTAIRFGEGFNLNGIAVTPDGKYLITVQSNTGNLYRIATDTKEVSEVSLAGGDKMTAGDGLLLDGQTLHVVRNNLNLIVQVRLVADYSSGQQIGSFTDPSFGFTTTIARVGDRLLVVNSQFNRRNNPNLQPVLPFMVSSVRIL
jgi:Cu-Zn family superoxide dismutase